MDLYTDGLYLMSSFYVFAGLMHFLNPKFFLKIMPPYIPQPELVNHIVGVIEFGLGVMLFFPQTRSLAAWGVIALLVAVFPANWYHHQKAKATGKLVTATLIRLPFQLVFIYWAYLYV